MLRSTFPTAISRQDLVGLSHETDDAARTPRRDRYTYFFVCVVYALGPSLLDVWLSKICKDATRGALERYDVLQQLNEARYGHTSAAIYAVLISSYSFAKVVAAPFLGHLSDTYGRQRTLVGTLTMSGAALCVTAHCTTCARLLLFRIVAGTCASGGLLTAYAADISVTTADSTELFGAFVTAWAVARVLAAGIIAAAGYGQYACCVSAGVLQLVAALLVSLLLRSGPRHRFFPVAPTRDPATRQPRWRAVLQTLRDRPSFRRTLRRMLSEKFVRSIFISSLLTPRIDVAAYLWTVMGEGPGAVGVIKAIENVAVVVMANTPLLYSASRRWGNGRAASGAALVIAFLWLAIAQASTMPQLHALVLLRSAVQSIYDPSVKALVMRQSTLRPEQRGSSVGLQQSMKGMAQVFGSWLGSYLVFFSPAAPIYLSAAVFAYNAVVIYNECGFLRRAESMESLDRAFAAGSRPPRSLADLAGAAGSGSDGYDDGCSSPPGPGGGVAAAATNGGGGDLRQRPRPFGALPTIDSPGIVERKKAR